MIYAIIDTNVIVSAMLAKNRDISKPFYILKSAIEKKIQIITSDDIFEEYKDVLFRNKFHFDTHAINNILASIKQVSLHISPHASGIKLIDNDDVPFYDAAAASQKHGAFLVTGNTRHFPSVPFVITPTKFYQMI